MWLGMKALQFSANTLIEDTMAESAEKPKERNEFVGNVGAISHSRSLFFIFLYKFVPLFLATWFGHIIPPPDSRFGDQHGRRNTSASRCFSDFCI